jgi:hypothetical protein
LRFSQENTLQSGFQISSLNSSRCRLLRENFAFEKTVLPGVLVVDVGVGGTYRRGRENVFCLFSNISK